MKWHAEDNMNDRRKENIPVPFDRRKRPDFVVHRAVSMFLRKAINTQRFQLSIQTEDGNYD